MEENIGALNVKLSRQELDELAAAVPHEEVVGTRYPDMRMTYHRAKLTGATSVAH